MRTWWLLFLGLWLPAAAGERYHLVRPMQYSGMADASGAVAVSSNLFVAADDEDNTLRLYRSAQPGPPLKEFDCNAFLEVTGRFPEADLEAGTRLGDRAFWIGSHGRNRSGKERANRCRLFATDIQVAGDQVTLTPAGKPYKSLLDDLISDPRFDRFHFAEAAMRIPKERDALNIEGLSGAAEGRLLIGFRNPVPDGKALLIPLLNPNRVIEGERARLGDPILLDLDGLGIRDIAFYNGVFIIIAGPYHGGLPFHLYRWDGRSASPKRLKVNHLNRYHPEALVIYPEMGLKQIQILSDDGKQVRGGVIQHELPFPQRTFRSFWVEEY